MSSPPARKGPDASVLYSSGSTGGLGYDIALTDGRLEYLITNNAPYEQLKISLQRQDPRRALGARHHHL